MRTLKQIKEDLKDMNKGTIKLKSARGNEYNVIILSKSYFNNILKFKSLKVIQHEVEGIRVYNVSYFEKGKTQNYFIRVFGGM